MISREYICLICVDPISNKWRSYAIEVHQNKVLCFWGRMNKYRQRLLKTFPNEEQQTHFLQTILKRRYRNGYRVIEQSEGFPELEILKEIPVVDNVAGQMRLF